MPSIADAFDKTKTMWMPGKLYIGISPPAFGGVVTLDVNGLPDATENPNAKHIGMTRAGTKLFYKMTKADAKSDELPAPHDSKITGEEMRIEGRWLQVLDDALLASISVGGVSNTITGGKKVSFGGKGTIPTTCVLVVAPRKNDPTKFIQFCIYAGYNSEGVEIDVNSEKENDSPFVFRGQAVIGRTVNDMMGYFFIGS